jgi:ADP-ribosyl-[dinitrogen reductase] hydrolase
MISFPNQPASFQGGSLLLDRALGSFLGVAIGDALGATVEFMTAHEIAGQYKVHKEIIGGGWLDLKPGHVTDDTEMALALGSALIASGGWNPRAIADAFVTWMCGNPVDIGNACRQGISRFRSYGSLCAPPSGKNGGNGAAMRNLPTVLASLENEEPLIQRSLEQAHITHNHPESDAATAALARMTRRLLLAGEQAACDQIAVSLVELHPAFRFKPWPGKTSGYIVDTSGLLTLVSGQILTGVGMVNGSVVSIANSVIAPGGSAAVGTLTITNAVTLGGNALMFLNRATHSQLVAASITYGGTLTLSNIGPALTANSSFKLFNAAGYNGAFTNILPNVPAAGLAWNTNALITSGTLSLIMTASPHFGEISISGDGNSLVLSGTGGVSGANYYVLAATNLDPSLDDWTRLLTNQFDSNGNFNFTNELTTNSPQGFYRLQLP